MDKIKREHWIAFAEKPPSVAIICLVTDGDEVAMARWAGEHGWIPESVDADGYAISFTPTHYMALSIELPVKEVGQ